MPDKSASDSLHEYVEELAARYLDPPWLTRLETLARDLRRENEARGLRKRPALTVIRGGRHDAS